MPLLNSSVGQLQQLEILHKKELEEQQTDPRAMSQGLLYGREEAVPQQAEPLPDVREGNPRARWELGQRKFEEGQRTGKYGKNEFHEPWYKYERRALETQSAGLGKERASLKERIAEDDTEIERLKKEQRIEREERRRDDAIESGEFEVDPNTGKLERIKPPSAAHQTRRDKIKIENFIGKHGLTKGFDGNLTSDSMTEKQANELREEGASQGLNVYFRKDETGAYVVQSIVPALGNRPVPMPGVDTGRGYDEGGGTYSADGGPTHVMTPEGRGLPSDRATKKDTSGLFAGIKERNPTKSEIAYFKENQGVGGMATEDGAVILNPFTSLSDKEKAAVLINEKARVYMRKNGKRPTFKLTPEQKRAFRGYGKEQDIRETIAARILSGDPSAGTPTQEQRKWVKDNLSIKARKKKDLSDPLGIR